MVKQCAGRDGGETSFQIIIAPEGGVFRRVTEMEDAAAKMERRLNRFVRFVAFVELVGHAFGVVAFLWATGVVLGGFCTSLNPMDFWFVTVLVMVEALRIFSRNYKMDNQSLFGTTKAVSWTSSSFCRMVWQLQEGDEIVLFLGLWMNLVNQFPMRIVMVVPRVALLVFMSRHPRWQWVLQTFALLIAYPFAAGWQFYYLLTIIRTNPLKQPHYAIEMGHIIFMDTIAVASLFLLKLRPHRIVNPISSPFGCKPVSFAKGILALWLSGDFVWSNMVHSYPKSTPSTINNYCARLLTEVVLLLGSLRTPANIDLFGRWIDRILRICYLWELVFPLYSTFYITLPCILPMDFIPGHVIAALIFIILAMLMIIGNIQIPTTVAQVLLSSLRFYTLIAYHDYNPVPNDSSKNMVPAIGLFYILVLCQGSLYFMASFLWTFSFFPRRSFTRQSKFGGQRGEKAIDLYYHWAYATCMDTGLLAARKTMSLACFAVESICSGNSSEMQLVGLILLDNLLLQETDSSEELKSRIISSNEALSMLIGMLGWSGVRDIEIKLFAAKVIAKIAGSISIAEVPHTVKLVSSLLDNGNQYQPVRQQAFQLNHEHVTANNTSCTVGCSWVQWMKERCPCVQWMIERCSIPEEHWKDEDSLPTLGMQILEKLAQDLDNCAEISKATCIIPKVAGFISYTTTSTNICDAQQKVIITSALKVIAMLACTMGETGTELMQKILEQPFLVSNLFEILEDDNTPLEHWAHAIIIIAKLVDTESLRQEIGRSNHMIPMLVNTFLGREKSSKTSCDLSLPQEKAGEVLSILLKDNVNYCSAILETNQDIIENLTQMINEDEYTCAAANLLCVICVYFEDKLHNPPSSRNLWSAFGVILEKISHAEGKQLEALTSLASLICYVMRREHTTDLQSLINTNGARLAQKLVVTLNSNKQSPEYPTMRRVIVKMAISLMDLCPDYAFVFKEQGMMDALSKVERALKVQTALNKAVKFKAGVIPESGGEPLSNLVTKARNLIQQRTAV